MTTSITEIAPGVQTSGQLLPTDYVDPTNGWAYDLYHLTSFTPGVPVTVSLNGTFDNDLSVWNETGQLVAYDNNSGGGTNAELSFTPVLGDDYLIGVANYAPNNYGSYELKIS
jgi:hypothetical protein